MPYLLLAADATAGFDLATVLEAAVETIKGNIFAALAIIVPAMALVAAAVAGVKFGFKWLRGLGKG